MKRALIILVVLVLILVGIVLFKNPRDALPERAAQETSLPSTIPLSESNAVDAIDGDLESIDFGDLDQEFEAIDQELESL